MASLLPTSTPSAQGVDARGVLDFLDALEREGHDPHSIVLARHGQVIARGWWEPYSPNRIQLLYSLSKSFAATAVGLLVDEGRVSLDTPVFDLIPAGDLPDDATIPERYRRLTLGQCLQMATGHDTEAWTPGPNEAAYLPTSDGTDPVLAAILAHEPEHEPGSAWAYNQIATYLVAAAVRGVTGGSLLDLLRPRLLARLDPDSADADAARWHVTATGRELGFSGLHLGTDAVHALAQTYLDRGRWQGEQLLSEDWVTTATTPTGLPNREEAPNPDWTHGYGCSFWGARLGYRGDGAYGQFAIVLPEQDIALTITEETTDMQDVLNLVWEHLVPAVDRPGSADDDAELARRLESLAVPMPGGNADGPPQASWTRSPDSTVADGYAAADLTADAGGWSLALEGADAPIAIGHGQWAESELVVGAARLPVVAAGGWQGQDFVAELRLIELPHRLLLRGRADGSMTLDWHEVPLYGTDPMALAVRFSEGLSQT